MKLMAIDYGEKRVGIASTDESGKFALPRAVFPNNSDLVERVAEFVSENEVELVIIGESKNLDGKPNPLMKNIEEFKKSLEERLNLRVVLHPEMLTTVEAARIQGEGEMIDASAAAIILKSYIETIDRV